LLSYYPPELQGGLTIGKIALKDVLGREVYKYNHSVFRPFHKGYLLTVLGNREVWEERRKAKPGDNVLVLVRSVEATAWISQIDCVAEAGVKHYQSEQAPEVPHYEALRGLPVGWRALHFQVREELPVNVPVWIRRDSIQPVGGLCIGRRRWLAGAGPSLLVRATNVKMMWIDGHKYPLSNQHITPKQAPCLDEPGIHTIWLLETFDKGTVEIVEAELDTDISAKSGWVQRGRAWPSPEWLGVERAQTTETCALREVTMRGPVILGEFLKSGETNVSVQSQWLELVMLLRGYGRVTVEHKSSPGETLKQPLLRYLWQAAKRGKTGG
jgi:hypothetical protein